jgi:hypothetical protein
LTLANLYTAKSNATITRNKLDDAIAYFETREAQYAQYDAVVAQNTTLTSQVALLTSELAAAQALLLQKDVELAALQSTVDFQASLIITLNNEIDQLNAYIDELEGQLNQFLTFDEARAGDLTPYGLMPILVAYESSFFPGSVTQAQRATTAPDPVFLDGAFADIKANNPGVNRIVLDLEAWPLVANGVVNQTVVGWYVTLINSAKAHFADVGLYGELPERYTLYMTGTASENITRRANWFTRASELQPMWDAVTTIYPSIYYINPVHNNATKRDLWYTDIAEMCEQFAPGKKVIPFMWPRVHVSVDSNKPYIDGDYWLASLNKVHELFDGYVLWLESEEPDLDTIVPEPLWWTRLKEFQATL